MVKDIRIEDFDYPLPDNCIPRHPLAKRDDCRLLVVGGNSLIHHAKFTDLPSFLQEGTLMVGNDTKVINARMVFRKPSGSQIEIFLLEPAEPSDYILTFQSTGHCIWNCLVGNLKRWKQNPLSVDVSIPGAGTTLLEAFRLNPTPGNGQEIEFKWDNPGITFAQIVETVGKIPIPPYLKRDTEETDATDYQTVYANTKGSVAAPTAGLHFTPHLIDVLGQRGIPFRKLTLHVGAGTFQPVKTDTIGEHPMHTESFTVTLPLVNDIIDARKRGSDLLAVGTTSVRTLESLPILGMKIMKGESGFHITQWEAYSAEAVACDTDKALNALASYLEKVPGGVLSASTAIMIAPGFKWRMTTRLITNFHQPQSTLLLLVSSFLGHNPEHPLWKQVYSEALASDYRFLSYGDACLFTNQNNV